MFTFAYPGLLVALVLVPVFVLLYLRCRWGRNKAMKLFGKSTSLKSLAPMVSPYKPAIKLSLRLLALTMLILAAARPWGGVHDSNTTKEGIEVVIAVDASNSMLAPASEEGGADRMRTAKMIMERLIDRLDNDRVGLIVYAGDAYTLIPVTNDYASAKMFLNSIEPSMIQNQGTDIGKAVRLATSSFSKDKNVGKAVILITDAEELESTDGVEDAVSEAADKHIQVDVLGVGGSKPVTIPEGAGVMMNPETGDAVRTAINETLAVDIAKNGKGIYVNANNPDALNELTKQLNTLQKKTLEASFMAVHDELYALFGWIALVCIIADILLLNRRMYSLDKISFFNQKIQGKIRFKNKTLLVLIAAMSFAGAPAFAESAESGNVKKERATKVERKMILEGNKLYNQKKYAEAYDKYKAAVKDNPQSNVGTFNMGLTQLRLSATFKNNDSVAKVMGSAGVENLRKVAMKRIKDQNLSSKAFYNMGNYAFIGENYGEAIQNYKEALRLNPADDNARRNLRIAQKKQEQNKDKNKDQNQQQQQQKQQQQQQQKQQQQQPKPQQIDNQTADRILKAVERKENAARMEMNKKNENGNPMSSSNKRW